MPGSAWKKSVREFWDRFEIDLGKAEDEMESYKIGIPSGEKCEKCGQGELLERISRHGFFLGCSRYPECDFAAWDKPRATPCPNCGAKFLVEKETKREGLVLRCLTCKATFQPESVGA